MWRTKSWHTSRRQCRVFATEQCATALGALRHCFLRMRKRGATQRSRNTLLLEHHLPPLRRLRLIPRSLLLTLHNPGDHLPALAVDAVIRLRLC